jgi:hypothetical protein
LAQHCGVAAQSGRNLPLFNAAATSLPKQRSLAEANPNSVGEKNVPARF